MREQHGRSGTRVQLAFHGALILPQNILAAACRQFAGVEIDQEVDFPGREVIACDLAPHQFSEEPLEAIEHQLALLNIVCGSHTAEIGGVSSGL